MITLKQIEELILTYGEDTTLKEAYCEEINKTVYKCPKCNGRGRIISYSHSPFSNPNLVKECSLCHGNGYTKHKYKPKMVQQGWEIDLS